MNRLHLRICIAVAALSGCISVAGPSVLRVPGDWPTIELAMLASSDSDTVICAPNAYFARLYAPPGHRVLASTLIESGDTLSVATTELRVYPDAPADSQSIVYVTGGSSLSIIGMTLFSDSGTTFQVPIVFTAAGAVYIDEATFNARRCVFRDGIAELGSAIWCRGGSTLSLDSCAFFNHHGIQGTVVAESTRTCISYCLFRHNSHILGRAAISLRLGSGSLSHCLVDSNGTSESTQPPVVLSDCPSTVDSCRFEANVMSQQLVLGNALVAFDSIITVRHCLFVRNDGWSSALYITGGGSTITDCLFLENTAAEDPAGLYCQQGEYRVSRCRFEGNRSPNWPAIYSRVRTIVEDCEFVANVATELDSGGAVVTGSEAGSWYFRRNVFDGNLPAAVIDFSQTPDSTDFRDNYWGDASGPWHRTENPNGQGDAIFGQVQFDPWLTEPPLESAPRPKPPIPTSKDWIFAYPNPFNMQVKLSVNAVREPREMVIYDLNGREVQRLEIGSYQWQTTWRADGLATGVYFAVLGDASAKLLMLK